MTATDLTIIAPPVVPIYAIAPHSRVVIDDVEYVYDRRGESGHRLRRVGDLDICEVFTHDHLHALIRAERIRIDEGFFAAAKAEIRLTTGGRTFRDLTEAQARKVMFKKRYCDRFLTLEREDRRVRRSDALMRPLITRISREINEDARRQRGERKSRAGKGLVQRFEEPSPSQLRRWLGRYEAAAYDRDGLIDRYRGPGSLRRTLTANEREIHLAYALRYASRNKPTKRLCFEELQAALDEVDRGRAETGLPPLRRLKRRAFERLIDRLDPFYVCLGREGREAAMRKWSLTTTGLDVERPFERVEMDEWTVDLATLLIEADVWKLLSVEQKKVVERTRAWLSAALDARTGMIGAMRFLDRPPSVESALATIELTMVDKSDIADEVGASHTYVHGKLETVATDNASHLVADAVMERLVRLGIEPVNPPAGLAEMRGRIERLFYTLRNRIAARFSGQTFANIVVRGDYESEANAVLDFEELNRVFLRGVLDIYHHSPSEALGGDTPWNCWRRLTQEYGVAPPPDRDVMRHVMGIACTRRIGKHGVRFLGIRYQSRALQVLRRETRQRPVDIRIDRFDLSRISVRTKEGWITVFARFAGLEGVSYWRWRQAVTEMRRTHAEDAKASLPVVMSAVRDLGRIAEDAIARAHLLSPVLAAEDFERDEKGIFRALEFADDGAFGVETEDFPVALGPVASPLASAGKDEPSAAAIGRPGATQAPITQDTARDEFGSDVDWSSE